MNQEKVTINPYLGFDKNCKEAMEFYQSVVGGELELMPFSEAPTEVPEDRKDGIMHAILVFDGAIIMASDTTGEQPIVIGNNNSISVSAPSKEKGAEIFNGLSEGGQVLVPYEKMFWGATFGMFVDKFGIQWMVNAEMPTS